MAQDPSHALRLALAQLQALQQTLTSDSATSRYVDKKYVDEFHSALDSLAALGFDIDQMRVPASEVARRASLANYMTGEQRYSEPSVERSYLLLKTSTVLGYFALATSEPPRRVGFHPPSR
jgi:hypothetical protein